jgi:hypothetical protein
LTGYGVDLVIFFVSIYEFDKNPLRAISDQSHDTKFIAANIKDYSVIGDEICAPELSLDVRRRFPHGLLHGRTPSPQGDLCLWMLLPASS